MNIRNIVTEKWNQEIIWANSNSIIGQLQDHAIPRGLEPGKEGNASVGGNLAVPLKNSRFVLYKKWSSYYRR